MSQFQWVLNFANSIVGVGVLAMPFCFQQCGIILAAIMVISAAAIAKKTCEFLLRTGSYTRKWTFEQIAFSVYGPLGKFVTEICIIGLILGTLVAYQVVIGDLSPSVAQYYFGLHENWLLRVVMMILSSGVILPLCFLRLSSLSMFNTASMVFYFSFILTIIVFSLPNFLSFRWINEVNFWRPEAFFKCLPIIALAFTCQTQVLGVYNALPEPNLKSMMEIIDKAINLVASIYITVGTFGYLAFYSNSHIHGDVMANFEKGFFTETLKLGFWASVAISFPLMVFPVRTSINSLLYANKSKGVLHDVISSAADYIAPDKFLYITLSLVSGTLIVGILVPQIELVLSITGALVGTFLCFVFPSILYLNGGPKETMRQLAKVILVISFATMILSTSTILSNIKAGPPQPQSNQKIEIGDSPKMVEIKKGIQLQKVSRATTDKPDLAKVVNNDHEEKKINQQIQLPDNSNKIKSVDKATTKKPKVINRAIDDSSNDKAKDINDKKVVDLMIGKPPNTITNEKSIDTISREKKENINNRKDASAVETKVDVINMNEKVTIDTKSNHSKETKNISDVKISESLLKENIKEEITLEASSSPPNVTEKKPVGILPLNDEKEKLTPSEKTIVETTAKISRDILNSKDES